MAGKILFVTTNHADLGNTGKKTGWYLPEVAHPYEVFKKAGYEIDYVSPKGGNSPMDPSSEELFKDDKVCNDFKASKELKRLEATLKPSDVKASDYNAIFFAGGHGPMFDLPENQDIGKLAADIYENGGVVSAVCHGTVGLLPIKLKSGELLIKGKNLTSFTNDEENAVKLMDAMPFALETRLRECGAQFHGAGLWQTNVKVSQRVVTGQNPASASPMAEEVVKCLKSSKN